MVENALSFDCGVKRYRIKPEPKYRPFKNAEECWGEMLKHQPFGWIGFVNKMEKYPVYQNILIINSKGVTLDLEDVTSPLNESFETMIFADGTPFGIKEED